MQLVYIMPKCPDTKMLPFLNILVYNHQNGGDSMPASYAHQRFGKQVQKKLPADVRQCIQRFRRMFDAGLQGPDIFFYYNPYWKTPVGELGKTFHRMTGAEFFAAACKGAKSEAARAYLYGLLGHYCLDSICHPFVNQLDAAGEARHVILEAQFERYLLLEDGQTHPQTYDMSKKLKLTRGECMTVAEFYPNVTGGQISRSVRGMAGCIRFLSKPRWEKPMRMLGLRFADHMIPAKDNEELSLYVSELYAHYREALETYPRMLETLQRHMDSGEDFGPDFERVFG